MAAWRLLLKGASAPKLRAVATQPQRFWERVRPPLRAAARRLAVPRRCAAERACLESDRCDAALRPSRFRALSVARERLAEGFWPRLRDAEAALLRVFADASPFRGARNFTPARRALESPMAMACLEERAPCLP